MATLIELLVKIQVIDERQHDAVLSRAKSPAGGHVVQEIAELGYATEGTMARAISVELGLPRVDPAMTPPEPSAVALLDSRTCAERFILPVALRENGEQLWLAMADPTDQDTIELVRRRTQKGIRPAVAGPTEISRAVRAAYSAAAQAPAPVDAQHLAPEDAQEPNLGRAVRPPSNPISRSRPPSNPVSGARPPSNPVSGARPPSNPVSGARPPSNPVSGARPPSNPVSGARPPSDPISRARPPSGPISRIARELGVEVPLNLPSRGWRPAQEPAQEPTLDDMLAPATEPGLIAEDDLSDEDLTILEALRDSLEKGAHILRSLAELCVEKKVFTREEMKRRNQRP